jgi:hypothetical protein
MESSMETAKKAKAAVLSSVAAPGHLLKGK